MAGTRARAIVGVILALTPACRRTSSVRGGAADASAPVAALASAPAPPAPAEIVDAEAVAMLLDAYADDLAEVADRVDALKKARRTMRSKDDPKSPFVRVPSPAQGARLAARPEVQAVAIPFWGDTTLVLQPLRGERACHGSQSSVGASLERGRDVVSAMCPSFYDDDPRAVDVALRRDQVHVVATVRALGICTSSRDRAEREAALRAARAFVGAAEGPIVAYLEALPAACAKDIGAQPSPGVLPGLGRAGSVRAGCTRGDSGLRRSWLTLAGEPSMEGDPREIGHYRPRAGRFFSVSESNAGVREIYAYAWLDGGVEVDVTLAWEARDASP